MSAQQAKVLTLVLKKAPFQVMITGEKTEEYQTISKWIISRLFSRDGKERDYDYIRFRNGYTKTSPEFMAIFKGFERKTNIDITYSNGLQVQYDECFL